MREINKDEFQEFIRKYVYWWGENRSDFNTRAVLSFILAQRPPYVEQIARDRFGFTDNDFIEALKDIQPGIFWGVGAEEHWNNVNKRLGINPPLPFPTNSSYLASFSK